MSDDAALSRTNLDRERQVWDALKAGDAEADAGLIAEDFLGIYPDVTALG